MNSAVDPLLFCAGSFSWKIRDQWKRCQLCL